MAKILIAEDERDIRELIEFTLTAYAGHQVFKAANGAEAVEMAPQVLPDLIMMDVRMPRMTGYEACRELKKIDAVKNIPVVFLSAKGQESEMDEGLDAGAFDYILKPFAPEQLATRVGEILQKFYDQQKAAAQASAQPAAPAAAPTSAPASTPAAPTTSTTPASSAPAVTPAAPAAPVTNPTPASTDQPVTQTPPATAQPATQSPQPVPQEAQPTTQPPTQPTTPPAIRQSATPSANPAAPANTADTGTTEPKPVDGASSSTNTSTVAQPDKKPE